MSTDDAAPQQELAQARTDEGKLAHMAQPTDDQRLCDSSDSDMPITTRRQLRPTAIEPDRNFARQARLSTLHGQINVDNRSRERPTTRQVSRPSPKTVTKGYKKPGPIAWASKPILKNDMNAKKAVIREIETYWGKSFIKSYIPKCHRPLIKGEKKAKRTTMRGYETDPVKWLPSILKAILMIAKLTTNKKWLKQAMEDVVRHRIKHTGNRKPQLVTTDFDIIEDMLVKQWDVEYAFEIRYKHLLVNRKDQEEADEAIDHLLYVPSDEDEDSEAGVDDDNHDNDIVDNEEGIEDHDCEEDNGGIPGKYLHSSIRPPNTPSSQPSKRRGHNPRNVDFSISSTRYRQQRRADESSHMQGFRHPLDAGGRSMPFDGGRGGYGGFSGYGGYDTYRYPGYGSLESGTGGRHASQQPPQSGMFPSHRPDLAMPGRPISGRHDRQPSATSKARPGSDGHDSLASGNGFFNSPTYGDSVPYQGGQRPEIKRESSMIEDRSPSVEEIDSPSDDVFAPQCDGDEELDAEIEATRLELKLARLRAKKAAQTKAKLGTSHSAKA